MFGAYFNRHEVLNSPGARVIKLYYGQNLQNFTVLCYKHQFFRSYGDMSVITAICP